MPSSRLRDGRQLGGALLPEEKKSRSNAAGCATASTLRAQMGRQPFMVSDHPDLQHALLRLSRSFASPPELDAQAMKRCVRYLVRTRQHTQKLECSHGLQVVEYSDADWTSGENTGTDLRFCSGAIIQMSGSPIISFSQMQQTHAKKL